MSWISPLWCRYFLYQNYDVIIRGWQGRGLFIYRLIKGSSKVTFQINHRFSCLINEAHFTREFTYLPFTRCHGWIAIASVHILILNIVDYKRIVSLKNGRKFRHDNVAFMRLHDQSFTFLVQCSQVILREIEIYFLCSFHSVVQLLFIILYI